MIGRRLIEPLYERYLRMQCRHVPNHIAVIQDGNRRYAKMLGIDTASGHRAGADKTEQMLDWAHELGITPLPRSWKTQRKITGTPITGKRTGRKPRTGSTSPSLRRANRRAEVR